MLLAAVMTVEGVVSPAMGCVGPARCAHRQLGIPFPPLLCHRVLMQKVAKELLSMLSWPTYAARTAAGEAAGPQLLAAFSGASVGPEAFDLEAARKLLLVREARLLKGLALTMKVWIVPMMLSMPAGMAACLPACSTRRLLWHLQCTILLMLMGIKTTSASSRCQSRRRVLQAGRHTPAPCAPNHVVMKHQTCSRTDIGSPRTAGRSARRLLRHLDEAAERPGAGGGSGIRRWAGAVCCVCALMVMGIHSRGLKLHEVRSSVRAVLGVYAFVRRGGSWPLFLTVLLRLSHTARGAEGLCLDRPLHLMRPSL